MHKGTGEMACARGDTGRAWSSIQVEKAFEGLQLDLGKYLGTEVCQYY